MSFFRDLKIAIRSLSRVPSLWITVALTLALGIGANAAIFSVVRAVLLRPLANRDEDRLLYIRQSAPGIHADNANFSIPEIDDLGKHLRSISELGTFSEIDFTLQGLGTPRAIPAGVVDGHYFEVMGLRPILGRVLGPSDDGPNAPGAVVLTYKFWTQSLQSDPTVLGKTIRLDSFQGSRTATIVGVLEPSVPYPVATEIIANVVTSPHHLSATMVTGREHRMTEVFGRLAPASTLDQARAELRTDYAAMLQAHPETYKRDDAFQISVRRMHDQINSRANTILWVLFAASGLLFVIACSNVANLVLARAVRRESELAVRSALGASRGSLRRSLLAEGLVLAGSGALVSVLLALATSVQVRGMVFWLAGDLSWALSPRASLAAALLAAALAGALATAGAADLPAAATAASTVGYAPLTSLGALAGASTASLNAFTGVMRAFFDALMRIASPVAGLRPMRAGRSTLTNLAKPGMETGSPLDTTAVTTSVNPSMTPMTVFNSTSDWTATAFASSLLFMAPIVADAHPVMHIFLGTNVDICGQSSF